MDLTALHTSLVSVDAAGAGAGASPNDGIAAVTDDSYICTPPAMPPMMISRALLFWIDFETLGVLLFCFDMLDGFMVQIDSRTRIILLPCFSQFSPVS